MRNSVGKITKIVGNSEIFQQKKARTNEKQWLKMLIPSLLVVQALFLWPYSSGF